MFRSALIGCLIFFLSLNLLLADTFKSKVKAIDEEKRTVTVEVEGKDKTYDLAKEVKVYTTGKAKKGQAAPEITITLNAAAGKDATITTDKVDNKDVVTAIKVDPLMKKKKKDNK